MNEIDYSNYFWQNELVRLRAWEENDSEWEYQHQLDGEGMSLYYKKMSYPKTRKKIDEFTEKYKDFSDSENLLFAIEALDCKLVGRIFMTELSEREGSFELHTFIGQEYRGKGYGTAAMKILLAYGFMQRRLHKYEASIMSINEAAIAMHKKLGCKTEVVFRDSFYIHGRYCDEYLMGLLEQEYRDLFE